MSREFWVCMGVATISLYIGMYLYPEHRIFAAAIVGGVAGGASAWLENKRKTDP